MPVLATTVALVAATPQIIATGDASEVEVALFTALADVTVGGSTAACNYPIPASTHFYITLKAGDVLWARSTAGGTLQVLATRS